MNQIGKQSNRAVLLDNSENIDYNNSKAHPIVRSWIGQLLNSKELAHILERYDTKQIDVTLYASGGRAVLSPKVSIK